jgi:hypothetical protein
VDEFFGDLRSMKHAAQSTIRSYQAALRAFCAYAASPEYGWDRVCEQHFGTHPVQVCFDWNTAVHAQATESAPKRRPFTRQELQAFFDRADDEVDRIAGLAARAGCRPTATRSSSRWPTAGGSGATRSGICKQSILPETRTPGNSASTGSCRSATAGHEGFTTQTPQRPDRVRLVHGNRCRLAGTRPPAQVRPWVVLSQVRNLMVSVISCFALWTGPRVGFPSVERLLMRRRWCHRAQDSTERRMSASSTSSSLLVASCVQADVDTWLADGPTTRHAIRTFFVWAVKNRTCTNITIGFRQAKTLPLLTRASGWPCSKPGLTDNINTLQYRVAATLLLLYAQPVVKIAATKSIDVILTPDRLRLSLGEGDPAPVAEPFASLLTEHLGARPNLRTGSSSGSEWDCPGFC